MNNNLLLLASQHHHSDYNRAKFGNAGEHGYMHCNNHLIPSRFTRSLSATLASCPRPVQPPALQAAASLRAPVLVARWPAAAESPGRDHGRHVLNSRPAPVTAYIFR